MTDGGYRDAILATRREPRAASSPCRRSSSERRSTALTLAEARDGLRARSSPRASWPRRYLDGDRARRGRSTPIITETPERALARRTRPTRGWRAARRGRSTASRSRSRTCSAPRACGPRRARTSSTAFVPPYESPSPPICGAPARCCSARPTSTSSPWARPTTTALRPGREPVEAARTTTAPLVPGGSSGGSAAAVAARLRWARPAPTPAARSASRRASAASSGSSRPMAAARAGASSRSPPRSTIPGRWRARCATRRSCCGAMAGHDPKDFDLAPVPVPDFEAACRRREGPADRHAEGIPRRRHAGGDRGAVAAGRGLAAGRRRRARRVQPAEHQIRAARPITSSRRPRPRRTSRATTACASACASTATASTICTK